MNSTWKEFLVQVEEDEEYLHSITLRLVDYTTTVLEAEISAEELDNELEEIIIQAQDILEVINHDFREDRDALYELINILKNIEINYDGEQ